MLATIFLFGESLQSKEVMNFTLHHLGVEQKFGREGGQYMDFGGRGESFGNMNISLLNIFVLEMLAPPSPLIRLIFVPWSCTYHCNLAKFRNNFKDLYWLVCLCLFLSFYLPLYDHLIHHQKGLLERLSIIVSKIRVEVGSFKYGVILGFSFCCLYFS